MQHLDYAIPKPPSLRGYPLHRMVSELTNSEPALFSDEGHTLRIRTAAPIDGDGEPLGSFTEGDIRAFELRACVSTKRKGKHFYLPISDWRSRHDWLRNKGAQNGFEILSLHSSQRMAKVEDQRRSFRVDQTDFTGILKIKDVEAFEVALTKGIGSTARTFGFGLLIV